MKITFLHHEATNAQSLDTECFHGIKFCNSDHFLPILNSEWESGALIRALIRTLWSDKLYIAPK